MQSLVWAAVRRVLVKVLVGSMAAGLSFEMWEREDGVD